MGDVSRRMRLDRRQPCLHECEARKGLRDVESAKFDAAEATALQARMPAIQSVDAVAHRPFVHSIYFFESNFFPVLALVI